MDDELRETLERLEAKIERLESRLDAVEEEVGVETGDEAEEAEAETETEAGTVAETEAEAEDGAEPDAETEAETGTEAEEETVEKPHGEEETSLEADVVIKWFGRIGALAVIVGVVLFFNYAIEQGWIGPLGRVLTGVAAGVALVGVGEFWSRREGYGFWAGTVKGLGVAVTYFAVYASYGLESYRGALGTSLVVAVAGMTVVVAGGVALALRDGSRPLSYEAFFLGYVTAFLSADFGASGLVYVLLLSAAVGAVVYREGWTWLSVGGAFGAYLVYAARGPEPEQAVAVVAGFLLAVFVVFLAQSTAVALRGRIGNTETEATANVWLNVVNSVGFGVLFVPVARLYEMPADVSSVGVFFVGFALLHAVLYVGAETRELKVGTVYPYLGTLFLVVAYWELLPEHGFVAASAFTAVALFAVSYRDVPEARRSAHALSVLAFVAAVWFSEGFGRFDVSEPLADSYLVGFGAVVVSLYAVYVVGRRKGGIVPETAGSSVADTKAGYAYSATAAFVGVLLVLFEAGDFFSTPVLVVYGLALLYAGVSFDSIDLRAEAYGVTALAVGKLLIVDFGEFAAFDTAEPLARSTLPLFVAGVVGLYAGYVYLGKKETVLSEREARVPTGYSAAAAVVAVFGIAAELDGLGVSAGWAVYGLALLALGVRAETKDLRLEAIAVLALATAKVFLFDTRGLGSGARIVSYITLGVILLVASFVYTRYREEIAETV